MISKFEAWGSSFSDTAVANTYEKCRTRYLWFNTIDCLRVCGNGSYTVNGSCLEKQGPNDNEEK